MTQRWTGRAASGRRDYKPEEAARAIAAIKGHIGRTNKTTIAALADEVRLEPRTLRAIYAAHDGNEFILHVEGDGLIWAAEFREEANRTTRRLESYVRNLQARIDRRKAWAEELPMIQGLLFPEDEEGDVEDWL